MLGLSGAIEMAKRALMAQQAAIDVYGHNIANVNTPGYTRQKPILGASMPLDLGTLGMMGTGVDLTEIERNRNLFADQQFRREKSLFGQADARATVLGQIEAIVNEPSTTGVSALLDKFFAAFSDLSNNPGDRASKTAVQTAGKALADGIRKLDTRLGEYRTQLNDEVNQQVDTANSLLKQVGDLNAKIVNARNSGLQPNDLRDQRDMLVDQLSELIGSTAIPQQDGSVSLRLGGKAIIDGATVEHLAIQARGLQDPMGAPVLYADGSLANIAGGKLGGLLELRDSTVQHLRDGLDTLATGLVAEVNRLHRQGPNGLDFFSGSSAGTLDLAVGVAADPSAINSTTTGLPGANDLALAIAGLKSAKTLSNGNATFSSYFGGIVSGLGAETRAAADAAKNQAFAVQQVDNERQSTAGVNLDEEMANMTQAQKAYQAAARYMTTVSDMLDTLINGLSK